MSSPLRELVLTGLPEFWPQDETRSLFLGPWCFAHNEKHAYREYVDFSVAPSPFRSTEDTMRACHYVGSLCDRLIPRLTLSLNHLHGTGYGEHFWKVATITWLLHWVGVCYDRYQRLRHVHDQCGHSHALHVTILAASECHAGDWSNLSYRLSGHAYNLQLMSDIIRESRHLGGLSRTVRLLPDSHAQPSLGSINDLPPPTGPLTTIVPSCQVWIDRLLRRLLSRGHPMCVLGSIPGVSRWDKLVIRFNLDPFFALRRKQRPPSLSTGCVTSQGLADIEFTFEGRDDFEMVVARLLPSYLPDPLMTCHPDANADGRHPALWIGNDVYGDVRRIYRVAHTVEAGGTWMSAQHGGGYGHILEVGHGKVEYETADGFVTWGWTDDATTNTRLHALPSPALSQLPRHREESGRLILVGTMVPAYHYRFHSLMQPEQILDVLEWRRRFLAHTSAAIRQHTLYRPYAIDYGVDEVNSILEAAAECRVLHATSLTHELSRARLAVVDHVATTLLQTLVMNVPTVLFWNSAVYVLQPAAKRCFDELRSVGILFDSPEAAARKVDEVWPNVVGWWGDAEIQKARRGFVRRYARNSKQWRKEWIAFLKAQLRGTVRRRPEPVTTTRRVVS